MNRPITKATPQAVGSVPGDNRPPLLPIETLVAEFAHVETAIAQLEGLVAHENTPVVVEDEEDLGVITDFVKKARRALKRIETLRVERKEPYLTAQRLVDSFFAKKTSRVEECKKTLETRGDRYLEKKEEAERKRRDAEAKAARETAEKAAREAEEKRQAAVAAAEKARLEAAKTNNADLDERARQAAQTLADNAQADLLVATCTADTAANAASSAAAKAAEPAKELARTHTDGGTASLKTNWAFEITNANIIDLNTLRPYLTIAHIEQAIRGYIKAGKHLVGGTQTVLVGETKEGGIAGVRIFDDKKGTYR